DRFLDLAEPLDSWPDVDTGTYYHVGEWSPVFRVSSRQILHVHFHKPYLISASLNVPGRLGAAALTVPGLTPRLRQRIEREWVRGEAFAESRINPAADARAVLAAARAIYGELVRPSSPPVGPGTATRASPAR